MAGKASLTVVVTHRTEVALGYLVQITSALLLLAQHFLLPVVVGMPEYGRLAFMIGSASLLSVTFDHGYNLLAVRKPRLAWHYLAIKLALLSVVGAAAWVWTSNWGTLRAANVAAIAIHAVTFVLYTFYVHVDISGGHVKRVFWYSLANGVLLLAVPLAAHAWGLDIAFAPAAASALSLAVTVAMRGAVVNDKGPASIWRVPLQWQHLTRTMVKQAQISMGTIIDGAVVWLGVIAVTATGGFEAAAVYRVAMSAVGLLTQALPMPKQVLLRVARQSANTTWAAHYAWMLLAAGAAQVLVVYVAGRWVLDRVIPSYSEAVFHALWMLSAVPALRALLELQTILHDRHNLLGRLARNVFVALVPAAWLLRQDIYAFVVAFYVLLCALGAPLFFSNLGRDANPPRSTD